MFRRYSRTIGAVILCFFTWTCAGGSSLAHAAQLESKRLSAQPQKKRQAASPEERLTQLTEELTTTLADSNADLTTRKTRLAAHRTALDKLETELHTEFEATEQKLKTAKLSAEILERHHKFVKHFDANLAELRGNLDAINQAKDDAEAAGAITKTRAHLEGTQAPSRRHKLDPANLPHSNRTLPKRAPRLKKEEFEKEFKKNKRAWRNQNRIMVASAGSLVNLLTSSTFNATTLPTADDLAETIDVQFTPEIQAKALELSNNPVKIYEWVRNNINFVPTWGSIQGSQQTLLTKQGNAFDSASLLIALLRAAGIQAHYVTGTIELPIATVMNWAGGFTDPMAALDFMSSGGIPVKGIVTNGVITSAQLEHVWVEAFINYIPSRGAKHVNGKGDTWIKLDPSFKQYTYTSGIDLKNAVPFDAQTFLTQIQSGATIDTVNSSVTNVNSLSAQQAMQNYQTQVQNYIQQNYPNATVGDVLGKQGVIQKTYSYLLGTLPYRTAIQGGTFTVIPDTLRHQLSFNVQTDTADANPLAITKSLPELAGHKITLSYTPATSQDEAVINSFLPQPHADGTPIQPSELPQSLPAYLINVVPQLMIDGQVVATGGAVSLGTAQTLSLSFYDPSAGTSVVTHNVTAGNYEAIGLNPGNVSPDQLTAIQNKLAATQAKLQNNDFTNLTKDDLVGDLLNTTAIAYHAELGAMNFITARTMNVNTLTLPSETVFSTQLKVAYAWGAPQTVSPGGLNMDAKRLLSVVKSKDGNADTAKQYALSSGMTSSALEHSVPEQLFSTPDNPAQGISAVKALKIANDQGMPIYTVNQQNIATVMPQLQVDQQTKDDITNAVNAGKTVTVSQGNINFNGWIGCGYIITDPDTGAGAYMISNGTNGAMLFVLWAIMFAITALLGPEIGLILMIGEIGGIFITTFITTLTGIIGSSIIKEYYNIPNNLNLNIILGNFVLQTGLGTLLVLNPIVGAIGYFMVNLFAGYFDMELSLFAYNYKFYKYLALLTNYNNALNITSRSSYDNT
jgi:hypothetical protein